MCIFMSTLSIVLLIIILCQHTKHMSLGFTMPTFTAVKEKSYGFSHPEDVKFPGREPISKTSGWASSYPVGVKLDAGAKKSSLTLTTSKSGSSGGSRQTDKPIVIQQIDMSKELTEGNCIGNLFNCMSNNKDPNVNCITQILTCMSSKK